MQKKVVALVVVLPLAVAAVAQGVLVRGGASLGRSTPSNAASDKNIGDLAEVARAEASMAPSSQAFGRARRLLSEGNLKEAEKQCRLAEALVPPTPGQPRQSWQISFYRELMGDILLEQGRNREALEFYRPRPEKKQNSTDPRSMRYLRSRKQDNISAALAYCRLGEFEMAKKQAPDFVKRLQQPSHKSWPGASDLRSLEASLMLKRGFEKDSHAADSEAVREYLKVLQMFPRNAMAAYRCARTLMSLERYDEALLMFARVVQFGEGKQAKEAKRRMTAFPKAQREAAMRAAAMRAAAMRAAAKIS